MQPKQRPFSSKPVSNTPILIDQVEIQSVNEPSSRQCIKVKGRPRLNNIVPELPQFGIKSNSTALLYSKFIVKGLKQDKISVVKSSFKKKQEITEAGTVYRNRPNKSLKTKTVAKTTQVLETLPLQEDVNSSDVLKDQLQVNTLLRASSAKVFRKTYNKQQTNSGQRTLLKNKTEANLQNELKKQRKRPKTAKAEKTGIQHRYSHAIFTDKQEVSRLGHNGYLNARKTAIVSVQGLAKSLYSAEQFNDMVLSKIKDKPIKIQPTRGIDHIEKNIQNISTYSRKTSSIYLTNTNIENLINKKNEAKLLISKIQLKKQNRDTQVSPKMKPQEIFLKSDKQKHEKKIRKFEQFLSNQMPNKFELVRQQIRKQEKKMKNYVEDNYQLLSKDLDNGFEDNHEQINQKSAKACYEDYIRSCQVIQYNISSKLKTQQSNSCTNQTLNILQCNKIIEVSKKLISLKEEQRSQAIAEIRAVTKNLKYFSLKPKQEIDKFFTIPFEIVVVQEGAVLIEMHSRVTDIFIILNGSVEVETSSLNEGQSDSMQRHNSTDISAAFEKGQTNQHSLYDGQIFGQPSRPSQTHHKCKVSTLEQSLLMKVKYQDYVSKFFSGSDIEQKLQILRLVFKIQISNGQIKQQDLQMISLSLQKHKYCSKSLIFRQGDVFDQLVLIGKGKLLAINEFILSQDKIKSADMKQIDRNIRQSHQADLKVKDREYRNQEDQITDIKQMRRQNLINYEVVKEDSNKKYYYFMKEQAQFIKGDSLNWEPICQSSLTSSNKNNNFVQQSIQAIFKFGLALVTPVLYSLMSNSDDTQIYTLSKSAFNYLPNHLKKVLINQGKQRTKTKIKVESAKQIKQWNNYKQKLCNEVMKEKKVRTSKYRQ